jgi:hypothetical protein
VTGRQKMLTPPLHLILPSPLLGVRKVDFIWKFLIQKYCCTYPSFSSFSLVDDSSIWNLSYYTGFASLDSHYTNSDHGLLYSCSTRSIWPRITVFLQHPIKPLMYLGICWILRIMRSTISACQSKGILSFFLKDGLEKKICTRKKKQYKNHLRNNNSEVLV